MEKLIRQPFQGVKNVVQFNWHFYAVAFTVIAALAFSITILQGYWQAGAILIFTSMSLTMIISLSVSYYIYDYSDLYSLNWLNDLKIKSDAKLINIHAGFDETSALLKSKFLQSSLIVFDFYDPSKHTEISIERARKAYSTFPGTTTVSTNNLPLKVNSVDYIFLILTAHEIRNTQERIEFFKQLKKSLRHNGQIIITEHLRDPLNFIAYNIGFFHFFSKKTWGVTFKNAGLRVFKEFKITPFISTFILEKNGVTS